MARDLDENSIVGSRGKIEPMDFGGSHGLKQPKKGGFSAIIRCQVIQSDLFGMVKT